MTQIFDNALPRESLEELNALFHDMDFPWFNLNVLALREHEVQLAPKHENSFASSGFFHLFCDAEQSQSLLPREGNLRINSYHWDTVKPIVSIINIADIVSNITSHHHKDNFLQDFLYYVSTKTISHQKYNKTTIQYLTTSFYTTLVVATLIP